MANNKNTAHVEPFIGYQQGLRLSRKDELEIAEAERRAERRAWLCKIIGHKRQETASLETDSVRVRCARCLRQL